ncbi:tetratricopeptide repeat protein [Bryobacter aggregatus]|uniref:tetratricopeptide repeat protein n=1 Tax=Bryobacter aggregatus TaxID=360054 RepID=UPI0004E17573|nr:hypothetical protein [Bryobacter aggregatus]
MDLDPAKIRTQLDRILASSHFSKAEKLSRFLRQTVENALIPGAEAMKEYEIGVRVYGRKEDFDPRVDSTVRAEAVRLRAKLQQYYASEGRNDAIRISLPKGNYVPHFTTAQQSRRGVIAVATALPVFAGLGYLASRNTASKPQGISSIAVLRFASLNPGGETESRAQELRGEVISALSAVPGMRVSASEAVVAGNGGPEDWLQLGKRLKVDAFLEGSVRREAGKLKLTAQLISAADGFHLWATTIEGQAGSDREVAQTALRDLRERLRTGKSNTGSPEAVRLYLDAHRNHSLPEQLKLLQHSVEADPQFALAWGSIAAAERELGDQRQPGWQDHMTRAKAAAQHALSIEETIVEAHHTIGGISLLHDYDLSLSASHLKRAVELAPRDAVIQQLYSSALCVMGRFEEAMEEVSRAQIGAPNDAGIAIGKSNVYYNWHKFRDAEEEGRSALAHQQPRWEARARWAIGIALDAQSKLPEAEAQFRQALAASANEFRAVIGLALVLLRQGRIREAETIWKQGNERWKKWGGLGHTSRSYYFAALGDPQQAVQELWAAHAVHEQAFPYFLVDPRLDSIRAEPGMQELLARVRR